MSTYIPRARGDIEQINNGLLGVGIGKRIKDKSIRKEIGRKREYQTGAELEADKTYKKKG